MVPSSFVFVYPQSVNTEQSDSDSAHDAIEHDEDKRERTQLDKSAEDAGLLPAPAAMPTEGPAPAA